MRLYQGDYARETVYSEDPVAVALRWQELGAPRIHVVDLDGAASGAPANLEAIESIARAVELPVQMGGGVRDMETAERALGMGVARVILGTGAVEDPSFVERACSRLGREAVIVGVDAKDGMVAVRGWQESTNLSALELIHRMAGLGVVRFVYTDISRDGTLTEPNFQAVEEVASTAGVAIVAAGGIASVDHLKRLASLGIEGAIIGKALYSGDIDLREAVSAI